MTQPNMLAGQWLTPVHCLRKQTSLTTARLTKPRQNSQPM